MFFRVLLIPAGFFVAYYGVIGLVSLAGVIH